MPSQLLQGGGTLGEEQGAKLPGNRLTTDSFLGIHLE